jgi:protein gp37
MAERTSIEWTDATWSPWEGCQKAGPGCDHCYAESMNKWLRKGENWGPGAPRREYSDAHWQKPLHWNATAAKAGKRMRVFPSVCDPFDNAVDPAWRARFFALIGCTPHLDWLLLTKRIGNAAKMLDAPGMPQSMPSNIWLGATVVTQEEADRDIPKLIATPASRRFLSIEPMLGPIWLYDNWLYGAGWDEPALDWVIAGGESGRGARPAHPDWFRSLRDQCGEAGVPYLFKQWGEWTPGENVERVRGTVDTAFLSDDSWRIYPLNLATDHGHIDDQPDLYRVGKKAAGRLLDGVECNGFPHEVTP